jgi:hypothetical protein
MKRIDWRLIRPSRDDTVEGQRIALALVQFWNRLADIREGGSDESHLIELEKRYEELTVSQCEASGAPKIADDTDWETRMLEEYETLDIDEDVEDFLEIRSSEPDCERCPYASNYSLFPMDPCEFSAGALDEVLLDAGLIEQVSRAMKPDEMLSFAGRLEHVVNERQFQEHPAVHAEDYLEKTISFLRFWSALGFSLYPALLDERIFELAELEETVDSEEEEPTVH